MDETQALQLAREAIRDGNKATAQRLLLQAIQTNPNSETAWLLLSAVVGDPVKERDCLERVLAINPHNLPAQRHLARLNRTQAPLPQAVDLVSTGLSHESPEVLVWKLPSISVILDNRDELAANQVEVQEQILVIEQTLRSFGFPAPVVEVRRGPAITQFGVKPRYVSERGGKRTRVTISRIKGLAKDLALALASTKVCINPVPGRSMVGIEVPNKEVSLVTLREVMESQAFEEIRQKAPLPIALGESVYGDPIVADLTTMPHLLIAGATGSGKSVCINSIIAGFLCTRTPSFLRMIMVDTKRVELTGYNGIPHLLCPVVVDLERVAGTLQWVTREMEQRYKRFAQMRVRNINSFRQQAEAWECETMPYIVVLIDELADLMVLAPEEVEQSLSRIAREAHAAGIHLIISTQRSSADLLSASIEASFPAQISFGVASGVDSWVNIEAMGANRLWGPGTMLFRSPNVRQPTCLQGCFVSNQELQRLSDYWRDTVSKRQGSKPGPLLGQSDDTFGKAVEIVRREGKASTTLLQRRLRIGYTRAAQIIEAMEDQGIVGPDQGVERGRKVL